MKTLSPFALRVYRVVARIPPGSVATYKNIALLINCKSPRAVASVLAKNPFTPEIPCHRVVSSHLNLTGYKGSSAPNCLAQKRKLLESEGVEFDTQGRVLPNHLWKITIPK